MARLTEQKIRQILSLSPAIIHTCPASQAFSVNFVSDNMTSRFGYSPHECLNNPEFWTGNIHPEDRAQVLSDYNALIRDGHLSHEFRFRKKDGTYLWVLDELQLICDDSGTPFEIIGSMLDITSRKDAEASLRKSEELFRTFFHANPVATIITSPSGVIHMVNPAFAAATDFTQEGIVGRTSQELGFWRNPADRERMVAAIMAQGSIDNLESTFYGKGGRTMTCVVSCRAVEFENEIRILSIVIDVTEQRAVEAAMHQLAQAKSDFISTAAHELRTPLIAIVGYAELLEQLGKSPLAEEQRTSYLGIIQNNAETLNRLVDDLLDLGRIQLGRSLGVTPRENNLKEIVEKAVTSQQIKSQQHHLLITHQTPLPETLRFDAGRISQVLNNLLTNAIKFSSKGTAVNIRTRTDSDKVSVAIEDQGMGMTHQQIDQIFDKFYRSELVPSEIRGLGLGMGIVRQIIDEHGGEVTITSVLTQGTTVTFTLPLKTRP